MYNQTPSIVEVTNHVDCMVNFDARFLAWCEPSFYYFLFREEFRFFSIYNLITRF